MLIPHVIYTANAGGYGLVARLPSMQDADANELATSPGLTEYLQREHTSQTYFSFFRLHSGNYALTQRFINGIRGGGVNRIVVHSLVFTPDILDTLHWDIFAIRTFARFTSAAHTGALTLSELQAVVGERQLDKLNDLQLVAEDNFFRRAQQEFNRWQAEIRSKYDWQHQQLVNRLLGTIHALRNHKRLILPQDPEHTDFLHLVWSTLSPQDRRMTNWTTHWSPGQSVFHLANTQIPLDNWKLTDYVFIDSIAAQASHVDKVTRQLIAEYIPQDIELLTQPAYLDSLYDLHIGIERYGLSLLQKSELLDNYLQFVKSDAKHQLDKFIKNGSQDLPAFKNIVAILKKIGLTKGKDAQWIDLNSILLGVCRTCLNFIKDTEVTNFTNNLSNLYHALTASTFRILLPDPLELLDFANNAPRLEVALAAIAISLIDSARNNDAKLLTILHNDDKMAARSAIKNTQPKLLIFVETELAFTILHHTATQDSTVFTDAKNTLQKRLTEVPELLRNLIQRAIASSPQFSTPLLTVLWRSAITLPDDESAQEIFTHFLLWHLSKHPQDANNFDQLREFLQSCPWSMLKSALETWHNSPPLDLAVDALFLRLPAATNEKNAQKLLPLLEKLWKKQQQVATWAEPVYQLFVQWHQSTSDWADKLNCAWWDYLTTADWEEFPPTALTMLEQLPTDAVTRLLNIWKQQRIAKLGDKPGEDQLVKALFQMFNEHFLDSQSLIEANYYSALIGRHPEKLSSTIQEVEFRIRKGRVASATDPSPLITALIEKSDFKEYDLLELFLQAQPVTLYTLLMEQSCINRFGKKLSRAFLERLKNNDKCSALLNSPLPIRLAHYLKQHPDVYNPSHVIELLETKGYTWAAAIMQQPNDHSPSSEKSGR